MSEKQNNPIWAAALHFCFTADELAEYKFGKLGGQKRKRIFNHLNIERCTRCLRLYSDIDRLDEGEAETEKEPELSSFALEMMEKLRKESSRPKPKKIPRMKVSVGDIWSTSARVRGADGNVMGEVPVAIPVLVVRAGDGSKRLDNTIRVMAITADDREEIYPLTLAVDPSEKHLPFPYLVEVFIEKSMLAGNLKEFIGSLDNRDLDRVLKARADNLVAGENTEVPAGYPAPGCPPWMEKDLEIAEYLSWPVYDMVWGGEQDEPMVLQPYKKAALAPGERPPGASMHTLFESGDTQIILLQKNERVLLKFYSKSEVLKSVEIDDVAREFEKDQFEVTWLELFHLDFMPESLKIKVKTSEETYTFHTPFFIRQVENGGS